MFFTNWVAADVMNPIVNFSIGGRGKNGGWFGWAEDAKIEQLKDAFARASSPDEQKKIAADIQKEAYRAGDLHPARAVSRAERLAEIAHRRARRPGDAGVLEYRQVGVGGDLIRHCLRQTRSVCARSEATKQSSFFLPPQSWIASWTCSARVAHWSQ